MKQEFLKNSVIVAAHPDDEVLWFSSILDQVGHVAIVYQDYWADPEIGEKRARAIADFPLKNVTSLEIEEAGTWGCADWNNPVANDVGLAFTRQADIRSLKLALKKMASKRVAAAAKNISSIGGKYRSNYGVIRDGLRPILQGAENVFTHNPWGEYGHEDHLQVHRAVAELRDEIGFRMWMSNYCSDRSFNLATRYFDEQAPNYLTLPTNRALAEQIADHYKKYDCWTWADDWDWYESESFMETPREPANTSSQTRSMPLNMICLPKAA
ncbi:MAG: hypothetical protein AAF468_07230 [Pseudomonadota bacterium]